MAAEDRRSVELPFLHPAIRQSVQEVQQQLNGEGFDFHIFEAFRSPQRQAYLYAQGRTRPGNIVTYAQPWLSYHQYGLAVDFVLKTNGNWDWSTSGAKAKAWKRLHEIGRAHGLEPLNFETPHLQMARLRVQDLHAGRFPKGGDDAWAENLEAVIAGWTGSPPPPPAPASMARPALKTGPAIAAASEPADIDRPPSAMSTAMSTDNFAIIQPFIEKWEGGFSNHPMDRGGPTNMGITIATLKAWRHRDDLTVEDVRQLSRDEARQIFKARYYNVVRGDDLPLPVAAAAYNAAVLHGPGRSAEFLQKALGSCGAQVGVDRIIGPETVGAVASVNSQALCKAFIDVEEAYLRSLSDFSVFGKGWMNRINDLRTFVAKLPGVPIQVAAPDTSASTQSTTQTQTQSNAGDILVKVLELLAASKQANVPIATPSQPVPQDAAARMAQIFDILRKLGVLPSVPLPLDDVITAKQLTPVNGALGQTIGKALDGKKSAIGIIGSLVSALAPAVVKVAGAAGPLAGVAGLAPQIGLPIFLAMTAWGALGKMEKWAANRQTSPPG
jgi:peptidoglycan L-alanyl-D-glutamate endopeptidase CwlK